MGTWSHQNAYRRKRYLEQTLGLSTVGIEARTSPKTGRPRCWAERGVDGKHCPNPPVPGTNVCRFHGGKAPQTKRLAAIRVGLLEANRVVWAQFEEEASFIGTHEAGVKLDAKLARATRRDPREVLLQQVHEAAAMAAATREMAGELDVEALADPDNEGHAKAVQVHELFRVWNLQASKASKAALDVGIDEAMVKLAEMQARAMVSLLKGVLAADVLQLTPAQQKLAQALLGKGLRQMIPEVTDGQTVILDAGGQDIAYNAAMDQYMRTDMPGAVANREYRRSREAELRERARLGPGTATQGEATGTDG